MVSFDNRNLPWPPEEWPRRIDERCDRYEAEWRALQAPRIEDYLSGVEGPARTALWLELVMLDQELRRGRGEEPTLADYRESCPEAMAVLDASTAELGSIEEPPAAAAGEPGDRGRGTIGGRLPADLEAGRVGRAGDPPPETAGSVDAADVPTGLPSTIGRQGGGVDEPNGLAMARAGAMVGDYLLLETLGAGGMGVVYKALQTGLNRVVALKVIKTGILADARHIRLFRSEAEAVAALDHPRIVPVLDSGEHDGLLFYSMKLIEGRNLHQSLGEFRARPAAIARLMLGIAEAIAHANERGVLHRDIKPSNILVDPRGEPHVIDFGLAMRLDAAAAETSLGHAVGTPGYMSPEQARGHRDGITTATDVYGLGTVLYSLLTGRPPFSGSTAVEVLRLVTHEEPVRPSRKSPEVDRDLEVICLKCLRKEAAERYASARELADDLRRWLDGRPILARPASRVERAVKWVRRRKLIAALSGAAMIGALLGVAGLAWGWSAAVAARDEARRDEDIARHNAYAADLNLAERDWLDANVGQVLSRLDRTRPPEGKSDLRGFEWYYLDRLCHAQTRVLSGQKSVVSCVDYSRDGRLLASGSWDGTVVVWDADTGRAIRKLTTRRVVDAVAFSPDGKTLACSTSGDFSITVWDVATGQALHTLRGHTKEIRSLVYSPDGKILASGGPFNPIKLWDAATGALVRTIDDPPTGLAFSRDGKTLYSARSGPDEVRFWDAATGAAIRTIANGDDTGLIDCLAITDDGKMLAAGSRDGTIHLRDTAAGGLVRTLRDHRNPVGVQFLAFSPDGKTLAAGGQFNRAVTVWQVGTGHLLRSLQGHLATTQNIAFSPDGVHLACASNDRTVRIWDTTRDQESRTLKEGAASSAVAFGPDGSYLVAACNDGTVVLHDLATGRIERTFRRHDGTVRCVAISPDGRLAASSGSDRMVRIWEVATGRELHTLKGHADTVWSIAFAPGGKRLATASDDRTVKLWDADAGREVRTLGGHIEAVNAVAFTPDGQALISAGGDDFLLWWDPETGRRRRAVKAGADGIRAIAISPDGRQLAAGCFDQSIRIRDVASGREIRTLLGHSSPVDALAFSADGRRLASASRDRTVRVWDPESGLGLLVLRGHTNSIWGVMFSPDGQTLASASADHSVKLWEAQAR